MKIGIITGASEGMGREFARRLAAEGEVEALWLLARREERLVALADELAPLPCRIFACDLTAPDALAPLEEALAEVQPQVVWAVAAAGFGKIGLTEQIPADMQAAMIDLNCRALTLFCRAVLPYMPRASHLVTLASAAAYLPQPRFAVYAATKAYVLHLSRALSRELRPRGIRVTAVCPGPVKTGFFRVAEETGKMTVGKEKWMADCGAVVHRAYRAARRGRTVYTPTLAMKLGRLGAKLLPHGWLVRFFG